MRHFANERERERERKRKKEDRPERNRRISDTQ